jgi:cell wall-associated NlpC family hydrolase
VTKRIWNYSQLARRVAEFQAGDPYGLGSEGPDRFDCSGLVLYAYENLNRGHGPEIFPDFEETLGIRTAESEMLKFRQWAGDNRRTQYDAIAVPVSERQPGDLVFYDWPDYPRSADHVAFWVGGGKVFDGHTAGVPIGEHTESAYWRSHIAAVYRIVGVSG